MGVNLADPDQGKNFYRIFRENTAALAKIACGGTRFASLWNIFKNPPKMFTIKDI